MENVIRNVTVSETALSTLTGNDVSQCWVSAKTKLGGCSALHVECLCGVESSDSAHWPNNSTFGHKQILRISSPKQPLQVWETISEMTKFVNLKLCA